MDPNKDVMQTLEPRSNGGKGLVIAILAVIAVLCVAGGVFAMKAMTSSPEKAVLSAVTATFDQAGKRLDTLQKEYPAVGASQILTDSDTKAFAIDYSLGFAGIEGIDYAAMISAFLSGSSLDISLAEDLDAKIVDMSMALNLMGRPFLEGTYFLSPEEISFSVPSFSDTVISVVPEGFAQKYPQSALGRRYPAAPQDLAMIQQQLDACTSQMRSIDPKIAETLEAGMREIGMRLYGSAEFSKLEQGRYRVSVPGEAARQALIDALKLCVGATYSDEMLNSMTAGGSSLREQLEEFYIGLPPIETTADLTIANKIVTAVDITCTPAPQGQADSDIWPVTLNYALQEGSRHDFTMAFAGEEAEGLTMRMQYAGTEANQRYQEHLSLNAGVRDDPEVFGLTWDYSTGKDGSIRHEGSFAVPSERFSVGFAADGTVAQKDGAYSMSLPGMRVSFTAPGQLREAALLLDFDLAMSPLDRELAAPDSVDLLSMSEEKLDSLYLEYSAGIDGLQARLYSLLLG